VETARYSTLACLPARRLDASSKLRRGDPCLAAWGGSAASPCASASVATGWWEHRSVMNNPLTPTLGIKLDVDGHETTLAATQRAANAAASWSAQGCWAAGRTNPNTAQHRVYGEPRERCGRGAPLAVCARAQAVEARKAVKAKQ